MTLTVALNDWQQLILDKLQVETLRKVVRYGSPFSVNEGDIIKLIKPNLTLGKAKLP